MRFILWAVCLAVLAGLVGCGGGGGGDGSDMAVLATSADRSISILGASDAVPPGFTLTVASVAQAGAPALPAGASFVAAADCGPDGTVLNKPVVLSFTLPTAMAAGSKLPLYLLKNNAWEDTGIQAEVSPGGRTATAQVSHFSVYALASAKETTVHANKGFFFSTGLETASAPNDLYYAVRGTGVVTFNHGAAKAASSGYDAITQATAGGYTPGNVDVQAGTVLLVQDMIGKYYKMKVNAVSADAVTFIFQAIANPPAGTARVDMETVFYGPTVLVATRKPDWSPDGSRIVFEDGVRSDVWRVDATAGAAPVKVTEYSDQKWDDGGAVPGWINGNQMTYYLGWIGDNDKDMHIMLAGYNQAQNAPPPTILHRFNASDLGGTANSAGTPEILSVSSDGQKVFAIWGNGDINNFAGAYTLNWAGATLAVTKLTAGIADGMVSRDGNEIVYQKGTGPAGQIVWKPFSGGTETAVGTGMYPTWGGDSKTIGYLNSDGTGYVVYSTQTGASKTYALPQGTAIQHPALSWGGKKIAFRAFGGANTGIKIGTLVD